jgi:DNA-binding Lrp family transcriptional regulator
MSEVHRELLRVLCEVGGNDLRIVARRMELSHALVEGLIEELEERGALRRAGPNRGSRCAGCGMAGTCDVQHKPSGWVITRQGIDLLKTDRQDSPGKES